MALTNDDVLNAEMMDPTTSDIDMSGPLSSDDLPSDPMLSPEHSGLSPTPSEGQTRFKWGWAIIAGAIIAAIGLALYFRGKLTGTTVTQPPGQNPGVKGPPGGTGPKGPPGPTGPKGPPGGTWPGHKNQKKPPGGSNKQHSTNHTNNHGKSTPPAHVAAHVKSVSNVTHTNPTVHQTPSTYKNPVVKVTHNAKGTVSRITTNSVASAKTLSGVLARRIRSTSIAGSGQNIRTIAARTQLAQHGRQIKVSTPPMRRQVQKPRYVHGIGPGLQQPRSIQVHRPVRFNWTRGFGARLSNRRGPQGIGPGVQQARNVNVRHTAPRRVQHAPAKRRPPNRLLQSLQRRGIVR